MSHKDAVREALRRASYGWKDENATRLAFDYSYAKAFQAKTRLQRQES